MIYELFDQFRINNSIRNLRIPVLPTIGNRTIPTMAQNPPLKLSESERYFHTFANELADSGITCASLRFPGCRQSESEYSNCKMHNKSERKICGKQREVESGCCARFTRKRSGNQKKRTMKGRTKKGTRIAGEEVDEERR